MVYDKVMVFGSFDVLHDGHRYVFSQAKNVGRKLIVVVARDDRYEEIRKTKPLHNERERVAVVGDEPAVDEAIIGDATDVFRPIRQKRPDCIMLGYDQELFTDNLREKLDEAGLDKTIIIRLPAFRPDELKSSILKNSMRAHGDI